MQNLLVMPLGERKAISAKCGERARVGGKLHIFHVTAINLFP